MLCVYLFRKVQLLWLFCNFCCLVVWLFNGVDFKQETRISNGGLMRLIVSSEQPYNHITEQPYNPQQLIT